MSAPDCLCEHNPCGALVDARSAVWRLLEQRDALERGCAHLQRRLEHMHGHINDLGAKLTAEMLEKQRLLKLFDDAGQGEHNVLALVDHYQERAINADARIAKVRELLEVNGCDCECDHHVEEHAPDCARCLACRIGEALAEGGEK